MEVIKVKAEDFSKYAAYIEKMSKEFPYIPEPYFYVDDEANFFVTRAGEKYGIVEEFDGDMNLYTLVNRGDSEVPAYLDTESCSYHFPASGNVLVSRSEKFSDELCFLSLVTRSRKPKKEIRFEQLKKQLSSEFRYDVSDMDNLTDQLNYCLNNDPNIVILSELKESILKLGTLKKTSYKLGDDDNYYRQIKIFDKYFGVLPKSYDRQEFKSTLFDEGIYPSIPETMASMADGTNEQFNRIRSLAADYNSRVKEV